MNNIVKTRENDDPNFLDGENNLKRGNKCERRFYDRKNNNENGKI